MDGIAGRANFTVQGHLVEELVLAAAFVDESRFDIDKIAKTARAFVLNVQFQNRTCKTFAFDFVIRGAYGTEKIHARLFKPDGVGGVVDNAHGVGFCVTDFDMSFKSKIVIHECNYR